jgi:hypothetical protein
MEFRFLSGCLLLSPRLRVSALKSLSAAIALAAIVCAFSPVRAAAQCINDSDCNDGLFCTNDHCIHFVCTHFEKSCDDFNQCTTDSCSESQNQCVNDTPCFTPCEDFNPFTFAVCASGQCVGLDSIPS